MLQIVSDALCRNDGIILLQHIAVECPYATVDGDNFCKRRKVVRAIQGNTIGRRGAVVAKCPLNGKAVQQYNAK